MLEEAKNKALDYIAYSPRTKKQVIEKLAYYDDDIIRQVIDFLEEYNYINDVNYAQNYLEHQLTINNKSIRKIKQELYFKGIDKIDIEEEHIKLELENISKVLDKLDYKTQDKNIKKLLSRGFNYSDIKSIITS
ncbi:MAG: hypothetical protein BEN19_01720 [Epulopiscium sp. Nuni2H_MBin003]|nr:MAG: hypothetical protein BEN19_01720 [Epulopiscium sp. Nuni2H_MBin003]